MELIRPTLRTLAETEGLPDNCSDTAQSAAQPGEAGLFTPQNNERVAEDQTRTAAYSPRVCTRWFIGASFTASSMKVLQKTSVFLKIQAQAAFSLRQCICTLTAPVRLLLDFFFFYIPPGHADAARLKHSHVYNPLYRKIDNNFGREKNECGHKHGLLQFRQSFHKFYKLDSNNETIQPGQSDLLFFSNLFVANFS